MGEIYTFYKTIEHKGTSRITFNKLFELFWSDCIHSRYNSIFEKRFSEWKIYGKQQNLYLTINETE